MGGGIFWYLLFALLYRASRQNGRREQVSALSIRQLDEPLTAGDLMHNSHKRGRRCRYRLNNGY